MCCGVAGIPTPVSQCLRYNKPHLCGVWCVGCIRCLIESVYFCQRSISSTLHTLHATHPAHSTPHVPHTAHHVTHITRHRAQTPHTSLQHLAQTTNNRARCVLHLLRCFLRLARFCGLAAASIMTPPRNAHVFASLATHDDFKKYRSAFVWLHRRDYKPDQDGYDAALQARLKRTYGERPVPIPVHLITFTRLQLNSVASTVSERLQQLGGAPLTAQDAWAALQQDRAGPPAARRRVSRSTTAVSSVRQVDTLPSPPSPSADSALSASLSSAPSSTLPLSSSSSSSWSSSWSSSSSSSSSSPSPAPTSSLNSTLPAPSTHLVPTAPPRSERQDVATMLTEMRDLQLGLNTARTSELPAQRSHDVTMPPQQALNIPQERLREQEASVSQLFNALAARQQELDASRTRELELIASQAQLSEALQSTRSALQASQAQLQRLRGEMDAMRHAADGTIARLEQELNASRAQLDGAVDAYRAQEPAVDELRDKLAEAGRAQQQALDASQARMQQLRQELDSSRSAHDAVLQRLSIAEQRVTCQEDNLNASVKIGYISRACQEFILRCPAWTQSAGVALLDMPRQDALDMVNAVETFDAGCSEPTRAPVYLNSGSTASQFTQAKKAFALLLHPDKIVAKAVPHRSQRHNSTAALAHAPSAAPDCAGHAARCLSSLSSQTICSRSCRPAAIAPG